MDITGTENFFFDKDKEVHPDILDPTFTLREAGYPMDILC
jgi:hypothetical protein